MWNEDINIDTLENFNSVFDSNEKARAFLEFIRWGGYPSCPKCNCIKSYKLNKTKMYRCGNRDCKRNYSVSAESLLNNTKITLQNWLTAIYVYQKSRGEVLSTSLADILNCQDGSAYALKCKLKIIFEPINKEDKSRWQVFKEACSNLFLLKDNYELVKDYTSSIYHIETIGEIGDLETYDRLTLYAKRRMYFAQWIWCDFASPQEIISEVYLTIQADKGFEYNADNVVNLINKTISKMWYQFIKSKPKSYAGLLNYQKEWKRDQRTRLKDYYIAELEASNSRYHGLEVKPKDIRKDKPLMAEVKERVLIRRGNYANHDFISHFN